MSFHVFRINEVYSNADGTIQFMEFVGEDNNQQFCSGHTITSSNGVTTNTFNIVGNLPSDLTNGKSVLVATQGFADLGIATPDYIIPADFLFTVSGTVTYVGMNNGTISYSLLPTDGVLSIDHFGVPQVNSPANYAGVTGTIALNSDPEVANALADQITGAGGNDTLNGTAAGGLQFIAAVFSGSLTPATLVPATDLFVI